MEKKSREAVWLKALVWIVVVAAVGLMLVRAYGSPQALHAPVWVVWVIAVLALIAPVAIFVPAHDRKRTLFWCALFFSTLSILMCWLAFGPGERNFISSRTLSFGPVATSSAGSEVEGRIFFGIWAIGFVITAAWLWRKWSTFGKQPEVAKEAAPASGWHRGHGHHRPRKRRR